MKSMGTNLIAVAVVSLAVSVCMAHPPDAVTAGFDLETHVLTVGVEHKVKDGGKHFIDGVTVELNGERIIEQKFLSQVDLEGQEVVYRVVDAGVGDEITVTADCSIFGKKSLNIEVTEPPPPAEEETEQ
jgi:hypothetical protein